MAIGYRGTGALATRASASASAASVGVPAGTAAGDLLLLLAATNASPAVGLNTPAGWTVLSSLSAWGSLTHQSCAVFWKVAGASEGPASLSPVSSSFLDAIIAGFTGVDGTTPIDATSGWSTPATSSTVTVPAVTTLTGNAWVVALTIGGIDMNASSVPSGWTQRLLNVAGNIDGFVVSSLLVVSAGTVAATSFPKTGSSAYAVTIVPALRLSGATVFNTWNGSSTVSLTDTVTTAGARLGATVNGSTTTAMTATVTTVSRAVTLHGSTTVTEMATVTTVGVERMPLVSRTPGSFVLVPLPPGSLVLTPR